jgi:LuxR family transcriptional regulator, maltose regulon positive regulatory protein
MPRPRLDALLDAATEAAHTLIVAPAGSGKTTAVAEWAQHRGVNASWYQAGGEATASRDGTGLSALLEAARGSDQTVVVDDAHRLSERESSVLSSALRDPEGRRLLVLSRREISLAPVGLALAGDVGVLRYHDLRLVDEEAMQLARLYHREASDVLLQSVIERAQGWAAGVVLGIVGPSAHQDGAENGSHRRLSADDPIVEYVSAEVLADLPGPLYELLASVCDEVEIDVQDAVTLSGRPDAPEALDAAAVDGFLVTAVDRPPDMRTWRPQPLVADVLRAPVEAAGRGRDLLRDAHIRAAHRYRRAHMADRALRHARLSADAASQLTVLRDCGAELIVGGRVHDVAAVVAALPPPMSGLPSLQAVEALTMRWLHEYVAAKAAADRALAASLAETEPDEQGADGRPPSDEAQLAILDVWEARCGWRSAERSIARASEVLHCEHPVTAPSSRASVSHDTTGVTPAASTWLMLELAALQVVTDDLRSARIHVEMAHAYAQTAGLQPLLRTALGIQSTLEMVEGEYESAGRTADACLAIAAPEVERSAAWGRAHLARGWARLQALRLDEARDELAAASSAADDLSAPLSPLYRQLLEANILVLEQRVGAARRLLDQVPDPIGLPPFAVRDIAMSRLTAAGFAGDMLGLDDQVAALSSAGFLTEASIAAAIAAGLAGAEVSSIRSLESLLTSRWSEPHQSIDPVQFIDGSIDGVPAGRSSSRMTVATAAWAAVARVAMIQRIGTATSIDRARALTADMLAIVESEGRLWTLAMGQMVCPTFSELLAVEAAKPDAHRLAEPARQALRGLPAPRIPSRSRDWHVALSELSDAATALQLTQREVEILALLASGGTNKEIAANLFVTSNTVKSHLASLYRKLGVDNRRAALAAARSYGLVRQRD